MSRFNTHIIHKKKLEIKYTGHENAFALQGKAEAFCMQKLLPEIEMVLNEFTGDERIEIGKLQLDFKTSSLLQLDEVLAKEIARQLKQKVSEHVVSPKNATHGDKQEQFFKRLIMYLKTGFVNAHSVEMVKNFDYLFDFHLKTGLSERLRIELLNVVQLKGAAERFIQLLNEELYWSFLSAFSPEMKSEIVLIRGDINLVSEKLLLAKRLPLINKFQLDLLKNLDQIIGAGFDLETSERLVLKELLNEDLKKIEPSSIKSSLFKKPVNDAKITDGNTPVKKDERQGQKKYTEPLNINLNKEIDSGEALFVPNAGLVLVASFLPRLFKNIGFVWNNDEKQPSRALALLHFISTGKEDCKDFELLLPKLLLGLPVEDYFQMEHQISIEEKEQVAELLNSVITHWSVLKSTSIEVFQQSFLQRTGFLVFNKEGNELNVETGPIDMLLNYVPWNFRMIKLPWMKQLLSINWGGDI